jgi:hypothetical protein
MKNVCALSLLFVLSNINAGSFHDDVMNFVAQSDNEMRDFYAQSNNDIREWDNDRRDMDGNVAYDVDNSCDYSSTSTSSNSDDYRDSMYSDDDGKGIWND